MNRRTFLTGLIGLPLTVNMFGKSSKSKITLTVPKSNSLDLSLLLACIAQVESGNNDSLIGKHGERSRYQITEAVWKQHIDPIARPFTYRNHSSVCHGEIATLVATKHCQWLDQNLDPIYDKWVGLKVYPLAICWHAGLQHWQTTSHISIELNNYATRVCNLYDERRRS